MDTNQIIILAIAEYFIVISIISIILCFYDKRAAVKNPKHRTREKTLLLFSALGGSIPMLITMKAIHHKTKHPKFMVGIPVIIIIQLLVVIGILYFKYRGRGQF